MPLVVDASTALAWLFADEASDEAEAVLKLVEVEGALVPLGWLGEVATGLLSGERRRRITPTQTAAGLMRLRALAIRVAPPDPDPTALWLRVLDLAREHGLTAYDAVYLELAIRERAPLATLDDDLAAAARRAGATLVS